MNYSGHIQHLPQKTLIHDKTRKEQRMTVSEHRNKQN